MTRTALAVHEVEEHGAAQGGVEERRVGEPLATARSPGPAEARALFGHWADLAPERPLGGVPLAEVPAAADAKKQAIAERLEEREREARERRPGENGGPEQPRRPGGTPPPPAPPPPSGEPPPPEYRHDPKRSLEEAAAKELRELDEDLEQQKQALHDRMELQAGQLEGAEDDVDARTVTDVRLGADVGMAQKIAAQRAALDQRIAAEEKRMDAKIAPDVELLRKKGEGEARKLEDEGLTQRDRVCAHGDAEVLRLRAAATQRKAEATSAAEGRARAVLEAARARAGQVESEGEKGAILGQAEAGAAAAREVGRRQQESIDVQTGIAEEGVRTQARLEANKVLADARLKAQGARDGAQHAIDRLRQQVTDRRGALEQERDTTTVGMETDRQGVLDKHRGGVTDLKKRHEKPIAEARAQVTRHEAGELAKLEADHARRVAAVRAKADAALKEIGGLKDAGKIDAAVKKAVGGIDQVSVDAAVHAARLEKEAEELAAADVRAEVAAIRAQGAQLFAAVDQLAARARQAMERRQSEAATRMGRETTNELRSLGESATREKGDLGAAAEAQLREIIEEGAAGQRAVTGETDRGTGAIEKTAARTAAEVDKKLVAGAVERARAQIAAFQPKAAGVDPDSMAALDSLTSLPPELQGEAMAQLDGAAFDKLIAMVPRERREELESLYKGTTDPARKLRLWGEVHKARAAQDCVREALPPEHRRHEIAASTAGEVDEEVAFLLDKAKGGALSAADVEAVIARKEKEYALEKEFNVNLSNDAGARADGRKIVWTETELKSVEAALRQMPASETRDNKMLHEIRRKAGFDGAPNADHQNGWIRVFDAAADTAVPADMQGERSGVDAAFKTRFGDQPTFLEMVILHEMGHNTHDQAGAAFDDYQRALGWEKNLTADQVAGKLTAGQLADLKSGKKVVANGRTYLPGGGDSFQSYDNTRIAAGAKDWNDFQEYFAEQHKEAICRPELLAREKLDDPAARLAAEEQALAALKSSGASAAQVQAQDDKVAGARGEKEHKEAEYKAMREGIFHAHEEQAEAAARLEAKHLAPDQLAEFNRKAARLSTREQIKRLEASF